jgi:aspartyl-tRNA(Asn)/glutamyl-tRNA(Gln) amidotransferase subunit C
MGASIPSGLTPENAVSLDKDQVRHIAMLARLHVADDDIAEMADKLSRIVDFVDQLSQAPTDGVTPMAHPLNATQRLRADAVTEVNERDHLQENAPAVDDGLYLVPRVIE